MARQKALSLLTALCGNSTFKDAAKAALTEAVAALVEYTGPPHPVYGDKPQQMLRATATQVLMRRWNNIHMRLPYMDIVYDSLPAPYHNPLHHGDADARELWLRIITLCTTATQMLESCGYNPHLSS
jgi:hypothetical protein